MSNANNDEIIEETRTDRRIKRDIEKLTKSIEFRNRDNTIIVADSKGRELQKQRDRDTHVRIYYQPGAKLRNTYLDLTIKRHLNTKYKPKVLIWLGTCELTAKSRNGFVLQPDVVNYVNTLILSYQAYKEELLAINSRATIIFLECPFFELQTFNIRKGHMTSNITKLEQETLKTAIYRYNTELIALNGISSPFISEDMIKFGKGKRHSRMQRSIDFRQLVDGCHPRPKITKLWLLKFLKFIDRL